MARLIRTDYKRKLDNDFETAENTEGVVQAVYASYLCVRVAGYLESCLKEEITQFIDKKCPPHIKSYIAKSLQNTTNLTRKKIRESLKSFCDDWCEYFEGNITEEQTQSIGSIYDNRNSIAHGQNSGITLSQIKKHYANIEQVVEIIHNAITANNGQHR